MPAQPAGKTQGWDSDMATSLSLEPCLPSPFPSFPCSLSRGCSCRPAASRAPLRSGTEGLLLPPPHLQGETPSYLPCSAFAITFLHSVCMPQGIKKNTRQDLTESNQLFSSHVNVAALLILNGFNAEFIC